MAVNQLEMHRTFLAEVVENRARLLSEAERLAPVEEYHRGMVAKLDLEKKSPSPANARENAANAALNGNAVLALLPRSDACRLALKALGGQAKTTEIVTWLRENGCGTDMELKNFSATCFTAMHRASDVYEKVGRGEWRLIT